MGVAALLWRPAADPLARIAQMGGALAASTVARGGIRLVTSLVIARALGPAGFGLWTLSAAAASTLTVTFDLGFGVLLTREAALAHGQTGRVLAGALAARLALFLPVGLLAYSGLLTAWIGTIALDTVQAVVLLAAAGLVYGCAAAVCRAAPGPLLSILAVETGGAAALCAGAAVLLARGAGVPALLHLSTAALLAQTAAAFVIWRQAAPDDRFALPSPRSASAALRRALPFALTGIVANAQARLGPILLGVLAGTTDVASFGVAARLESVARRLPSSAFGAALPVLAQEATRGQAARVQDQCARALRWFAAVAALVLVAGAGPIVRLTYGPPFAAAAMPLVAAGLGLVPALLNSSRKVYLYAAGREQAVLRLSAATLGAQVAGCLLLVPRFGASGAMAGIAIGEALMWLPLRRAARL